MILSYSIISSIILAFGYFAYRFIMAGQSQHSLNRATLIGIYCCSIIAPLIVLSVLLHNPVATDVTGNIEIGEITGGILTNNGGANSWSLPENIAMIVTDIFLAGMVVTALYFLIGLLILRRIINRGEKTEFPTFSLILVDNTCKTAPFSWGRSIVMTRNDYDEFGDMILLHEHAHRRCQHWLDLILAYSTICLQWYNPAAWAMREQLRAVHEYQADEIVTGSGVDKKEYQMLLLQKAVGYGYQSLANSLNHSKLQKRVTMMYKKKTSLKRRLFALALLPAIGAGIAVTAIPSVAGVLESLAVNPVKEATATPSAMPADAAKEKERDIFVAVETQAEFPDGMNALMKWLQNNIRYPEAAMKADVQGRVIVKFIIEADGSVTNARVVKGVSPELDAEALRVVGEMPKWIPGKNNGNAVASYFTLPINFRLEEDKKEEGNKSQE